MEIGTCIVLSVGIYCATVTVIRFIDHHVITEYSSRITSIEQKLKEYGIID